MSWEDRYKEALGWMRDLYPSMSGSMKEDAEHYFPELKVTEDEMIIDEITDFIVHGGGKSYDTRWIDWLKKNKPQETPKWMIDFLNEHRCHLGAVLGYDERREQEGSILAIIEWLKGHRIAQKEGAWKPSEGHIEALEHLIYRMPHNLGPSATIETVKDLKRQLEELL